MTIQVRIHRIFPLREFLRDAPIGAALYLAGRHWVPESLGGRLAIWALKAADRAGWKRTYTYEVNP